jgi:hypothetical protein
VGLYREYNQMYNDNHLLHELNVLLDGYYEELVDYVLLNNIFKSNIEKLDGLNGKIAALFYSVVFVENIE